MNDTVVVTSPDDNVAVLEPSIQDAIAAAQYYLQLVLEAEIVVLAAQKQVNISTTEAMTAAASAQQAATSSAATAASAFIPLLNIGSPTIATRSRLRRAINAIGVGKLQQVDDFAMNNYDRFSDTFIEWTEAVYIPIGGLAYTMVGLALSYNASQLATLWANAYVLPN